MSVSDRLAQRNSFVYGNTKVENEKVTRELVAQIGRQIDSDSKG